jgi:uncharacterized protein (TIGR00255 family)
MEKIEQKYKSLTMVINALNMDETVRMDHLVAFPEIFESDYSKIPESVLIALLEEAVKKAVSELNLMRKQEGAFLEKDMSSRINMIEQLIEDAYTKSRSMVSREFDRLRNQVLSLIGEQKIDSDRMEQEVALIADKVDITEACIRSRSHIKLFRETLRSENELGKKLSFILQEMLREANTINSKSTDIDTLHNVIRIKEEIEKLREQSQNIE